MVARVSMPQNRARNGRTFHLRGAVQGLGIRPAVACLARSLDLCGSVRNDQQGVCIELFGAESSITIFLSRLGRALPTEFHCAEGDSLESTEAPAAFQIVASQQEGPSRTSVPLDRKVCDQCLSEMDDPSNRRHDYPFISCTLCGPRYSILESMPYDRQRTSMSHFEMCARCLAEYNDPSDRRFHSQTNCCAECGPRWWSVDHATQVTCLGWDAMLAAENMIRQGGIVAIKGVGGYQLLCDATNESPLTRLRAIKHRPCKAVAVMVGSPAEAMRIASLSRQELAALTSPAGPIVIARQRTDHRFSRLFTRLIHPRLQDVGLILPTTPLHHWLCRRLTVPLVATSGNREGEPLVYQQDQADARLSGLADLCLHHDREIIRPIDDGVVRSMANRMVTLRAGRGLAPLAIPSVSTATGLAVGGHQKVALALGNGHQSVLGPHIGDMDHTETRQRYIEQAESLCQLHSMTTVGSSVSGSIAHDMHTEYFTTRWVEDSLGRRSDGVRADGVRAGGYKTEGEESEGDRDPTCEQQSCARGREEPQREAGPSIRATSFAVQHHHAHVVSGMVEHGWLDRTVLGIAMDGTGLGTDGAIWGGEVLRCTAHDSARLGHLLPFRLVGGEAAIRDPRRVAFALIAGAMGVEALQDGKMLGFDSARTGSLIQLLSNMTWSPITTSVGRLFDGVAAIALREADFSYEGEAAMRLEASCDLDDREIYPFPLSHSQPFELDWRPMIRQLVSDRRAGITAGAIAMRFHRGLAHGIVAIVNRFPSLPIMLAGGVFQNRVLVELIFDQVPSARELEMPCKIPPNDGGLAAGQLAVAQQLISRRSRECV